MNYLKPIYHNEIGATYVITSDLEDYSFHKINLQLAEFSIMLTVKELKQLLNTLEVTKNSCTCPSCKNPNCVKFIKCDTTFATINLKVTSQSIKTMEELINGTFFELAMENLLNVNDIG